MSTVITIMDRHGYKANTDIIVLVDPARRRLLWIPRDLWCGRRDCRINEAFKQGEHTLLLDYLRDHAIEARTSLCLNRRTIEKAFSSLSIVVPVPVRMRFSYPLTPTSRIEEGSKTIEFNPPAENLSGERIHQWIGARGATDLHRIERQKIFLRRLLDTGFDFSKLLQDKYGFKVDNLNDSLTNLKQVRSDWTFDTLGPLQTEVINGRQVLVPIEAR